MLCFIKLFVTWGSVCWVLLNSVHAGQSPPLSLSEVVLFTLQDNPTLKDACDTIKGARYGLDVAEADFQWRFTPQSTSGLGSDTETSQSAALSLGKKFKTGTALDFSAGTTSSGRNFYRSFAGVTFSQSLLRGFGSLTNESGVVAAKRRIITTERQFALVKEQIVIDAIVTFYRIVGQKLVVEVLQKSLDRAQRLLVASQVKLERGGTTKIDIFRVQNQAALAESSLLDAQEAMEEAKDALKMLLGRPLVEALEVESQIVPFTVELIPGDLLESTLEHRIDLQEMADQVGDAERNLQIAGRNLYPDIRVGFNYALVGRGGNFIDSTGFDDSKFQFLFSTSTPLTRSAERAQYHQAQLELTKKKREIEESRKKVIQEVRQALRHVATLERRIAIQEKNVQAAQANIELANLRFERGYANTFETLQSEESLTQAQREEVNLRIEQATAGIQLRKAAGRLGPFIDAIVKESTLQSPCF